MTEKKKQLEKEQPKELLLPKDEEEIDEDGNEPVKNQWQKDIEEAKEIVDNMKEMEKEADKYFSDMPKEDPEEQPTWQEDERFKHSNKDKPSKKMKREMEKEIAKEKRINLAAKAKHFMSGGLDVQGWTIIKVIRLISMIFGWLLNLFTVAVMIYLVVDVIVLFKYGSINDYYMIAKVILEMVFLWMIVKIHEKIEV